MAEVSAAMKKLFGWMMLITNGAFVLAFPFWCWALFEPRWFELEVTISDVLTKLHTTIFQMLEMYGRGTEADNPVLVFHGVILVTTLTIMLWHVIRVLHTAAHHAFNKREEIKNFTAYHGTILISGILFGICFYDLHEKDFYRDGSSSTERILDFNEHVTRSGKVAFAAWLATMSSAFAGLFYVFLTDAWKKFGAPKSGNK